MNNYVRFFELSQSLPHSGLLLLQRVYSEIRYKAIQCIIAAYKPSKLCIDFLQCCLGYNDVMQCREYAISCGAVITDDELYIITTQTELHEPVAANDDTADTNKGVTHSLT